MSQFGWFSSKGINNEELDNILLGRAVLQMASKFGFSFKLHRDFDINNFKNNMKFILKNYFEETCYKNINENVIKNEKEPLNCKYEFSKMKDELHILGMWPREIIEELCKLYIVDENNDIKIFEDFFSLKQEKDFWLSFLSSAHIILERLEKFIWVEEEYFYQGIQLNGLSLFSNEVPLTILKECFRRNVEIIQIESFFWIQGKWQSPRESHGAHNGI